MSASYAESKRARKTLRSGDCELRGVDKFFKGGTRMPNIDGITMDQSTEGLLSQTSGAISRPTCRTFQHRVATQARTMPSTPFSY
jgi:hypothetical protein